MHVKSFGANNVFSPRHLFLSPAISFPVHVTFHHFPVINCGLFSLEVSSSTMVSFHLWSLFTRCRFVNCGHLWSLFTRCRLVNCGLGSKAARLARPNHRRSSFWANRKLQKTLTIPRQQTRLLTAGCGLLSSKRCRFWARLWGW